MTTPAPPPSQWVDLGGDVHYVDYGGPAEGPLLVCVHGLGGSHLNWAALAPHLTQQARVIAIDLPGFGLTRPGSRAVTVHANQAVLHRFLTDVVGGPAILLGNSMGGLITLMETAAHPEIVAGAILVDPALPLTVRGRPDPLVSATFAMYAVPRLGMRVLNTRRRLGPRRMVAEVLQLCCVDPGRVPADVVEEHVALARARGDYPEAPAAMIEAARSLMLVLARRRRFAAMIDGITAPVLLLHGDSDRLVPLASAQAVSRARPAWRFEVARDIGHVPQLEDPAWTAAQILDWLATDAMAAAARAGTVRSLPLPAEQLTEGRER